MTRKLTFLILALFALIAGPGWGQNVVASYSRSGTTNTTSGGTFTQNLSGKTGYYQDNSTSQTYFMQLKNNSAYWTDTPQSISFTANLGGGTTKDPLGDGRMYVVLLDNNGNEISTTVTEVTNKITNTDGSNFTVSITPTANVYGVKLYHSKITSYNVRYYAMSLSYEAGGSTVATPTFNPAAGTYYEDKTIELSAEEGCTIYYTLNGTTPTAESTEYSTPIQLAVPSTTTIKAIAVDGENNSSNVASATYILKRSQYTPAQLLAEVVPDNQSYTVVFTDEVIKSFYVYNNNNAGFYIETTEGDFLVYKSGTPSNWEVGGKVSGTVSGTWKTYSNLKEFCPADYNGFSYTPPTQQLPAPTNLTVSDLNMTGATLSWNAVEHASSYTVYVTDLDAYENTIEGIETTSVVLNDLTAGTEYMWTVQAIGDGEIYLDSEESETAEFTTPTTALYDVIFETQQTGGTIEIDKTQAAAGEEVMAIATAADHFSFTQWNFSPAVTISEGEITDDAITFIMPASDVTVTATFTEEAKYTVTYAKGGDDVTGEIPTVASYYAGETVEVAENPFSYVGHTFNGWSFNPIVEIVNIDDVDYFEMPASNVTVTATWAGKAQYTVTYMSLGAQIGTEQVYEGDLCANVPTVSNIPTGWTFLGWTTGSADNTTTAPEPFDLTTPIISATTLNAVFTKTEGEASWDESALDDLTSSDVFVMVGNDTYAVKNTESTNKGPAPVEVTINGQTVTEPSDNIKWTLSGNGTDGYTFYSNANSEHHLYCSTTATSSSNDNMRVGSGGTTDRKVFVLDDNHLKTNDNYTTRYIGINGTSDFRGYTSSSTNSVTFKFYKLNAGTTYYTTVAPASEYAIAIDESIEHGTIEVENGLTAAAAGTEITLIVTPEEHYSLAANSLTVTGASSATVEVTPVPGEVIKYTFVMPAEAVTITAQFTENPKFTVSCYANGTLVPTEQVYAGEMQLPVSVTAPNGYTFVGWTNQQISGVAESASYFSSYNVTEDVDLYAVFVIATKGGNSYRLSSTAPAAGDNVIVAGKKDDKYYALWVESTATSTELTIANGVVTNYEGLIWSASYDEYNEKYGIVLNNGTNPLHMNSSALKVASSNQNGTFEFPVSGDGFNIYGNQNTRWMTFNGTTFGVTSDETSASTLYFFKPVTYSNYCTTVTDLSGNLVEATTEADNAYYISEEAYVPANATATINGVLGNADASLLIINDGAQLIHHNAGVAATFQKSITGYTGDNDNYYLIAAPIADASIEGLTTNEYDLFSYDEPTHYWFNQKGTDNPFNTLSLGQGYLYANSTTGNVTISGIISNEQDPTIAVTASASNLTGFNLVGNPFTYNLNIGNMAMMDNTDIYYITSIYQIVGTAIVVSQNTSIAPCEGFFIQAPAAGELFFNAESSRSEKSPVSDLKVEVKEATRSAQLIDRAYVNFSESRPMNKFYLNENSTRLYIPQNGEDYAVVMASAAEGELPMNFKAEKNGTYTITVSTENVDAEYLHLIDNMTGMDVDLLSTPSYTFEAKTSDYASRFKLVFGVKNEASESSDSNFAFMSNGNLVIDNIEGEATLQIVDELGRVISTETVSGSYNKALNLKAGLYILNLNGMTQKIVVK